MVHLKYWNPLYQIAVADWKTAYQFPQKERMLTEVYRGALYYRLPGSPNRISYQQLKKGLQRRDMGIINELLPF
jgi:hypothetical protein